MRLSDYIIIFFVIFGGLTLFTFYSINMESEANITNTEYANVLTAATQDAAGTIDFHNVTGRGVWTSEEKRNLTLDTFYTTLKYGFNFEYTAKEDEVYIYTPVVCLIDNNGYYISYNSSFDESGSTKRPIESSDTEAKAWTQTTTVSPLLTWAKKYGDFTVRYYLDDTMDITLPTGEVINGKREKILTKIEEYFRRESLSDSAMNIHYIYEGLNSYSIKDLINNKDGIYDREKYEYIVRKINEEVEYYINHQNLWAADLDIPYSFTMPEIASEDWHRLLANPTVISFLQGAQAKTQSGYINIYALAGGEITKDRQYYITEASGRKTYHYLSGKCPYHTIGYTERELKEEAKIGQEIKQIITKREYYTCDGQPIRHIYASMEDCAKENAYPCECAINHNH